MAQQPPPPSHRRAPRPPPGPASRKPPPFTVGIANILRYAGVDAHESTLEMAATQQKIAIMAMATEMPATEGKASSAATAQRETTSPVRFVRPIREAHGIAAKTMQQDKTELSQSSAVEGAPLAGRSITCGELLWLSLDGQPHPSSSRGWGERTVIADNGKALLVLPKHEQGRSPPYFHRRFGPRSLAQSSHKSSSPVSPSRGGHAVPQSFQRLIGARMNSATAMPIGHWHSQQRHHRAGVRRAARKQNQEQHPLWNHSLSSSETRERNSAGVQLQLVQKLAAYQRMLHHQQRGAFLKLKTLHRDVHDRSKRVGLVGMRGKQQISVEITKAVPRYCSCKPSDDHVITSTCRHEAQDHASTHEPTFLTPHSSAPRAAAAV